MRIKVKLAEGAKLPEYKTVGAAGADIYALLDKDTLLPAGQVVTVPTGLFFEIEEGYAVDVRPRSGLAAKNGITVLNTPGLCDEDYRGEIKVILYNSSNEDFIIHNGDRIAQMTVAPVIRASFETVEELGSTERGSGGFGSTGK